MAGVVVTVGGRQFTLACGAGEEARTRRLARYVDGKLGGFAAAGTAASETQLLLLAALVIADELADANDALVALRERAAAVDIAPAGESEALAERVEALASRLEGIAARLEST